MAGERRFVAKDSGGVLEWALANVPGLSRTEAKKMLGRGMFAINGTVAARHDTPVSPGDEVTIGGAGGGGVAAAASAPFPILLEDGHLVVIDKPAGLLTMANDNERERTAHRLLGERSHGQRGPGRVFVVHRLDRETSGVLLFAKSEAAKRTLQDQWETTRKEYIALVEGVPREARGKLVDWLREDAAGGLRVHVVAAGSPDAREAVSHYEVISSRRDKAMLRVRIDTGRKHQIRVQLAHMGHPVLGDDRYGKGRDTAPRLALHAARLEFTHPVTGAQVVVEAPLPDVLKRLV